MRKIIILLTVILFASCLSIPGPENEESILLVIKAKYHNEYPDLYTNVKIYMSTNQKDRILLKNGTISVIEGLKAGTLFINGIWVESDIGIISGLTVNHLFKTEGSTIYIIEESYNLGSNAGKGGNESPRIDEMSETESENIVNYIKDDSNYSAWKGGHKVISRNL